MYAGYCSGEEHIKNSEKALNTMPRVHYSNFDYKLRWGGDYALKKFVDINEKMHNYIIKIVFILVFLVVLRTGYGLL